jgi:hypothetical protein
LKFTPFAALVLFSSLASGQLNLGGSSALTNGIGTVGQRSGKDVDLKYYVSAMGIYDTGLTPYAISSGGTLVQLGGLKGVEAGIGGYGRHSFRRSSIGLDYSGNFRHYTHASNFDGSNQSLTLEHVYQPSRRLLMQTTANAGTQSFGTTLSALAGSNAIVDSSSLLFDNRTSFVQTSFTTRYALTNRTSISMGGTFYAVHRQAAALVGVRGYSLQGSLNRQLSRRTFIGATFQHMHFDFPRAFGESDINSYTGTWQRTFGRNWSLNVIGGVFHSQVQGVESTALDPTIAALLGISSVNTIFYRANLLPTGNVIFTRQFRRSSLSGAYSRTVTPGNGIFLTTKQTSYGGTYSFTGLRRMSFSMTAGKAELSSLGPSLQPFNQLYGSVNLGYRISQGMNLSMSYARRRQDLVNSQLRPDSSRISIGISFSPGEIPVSLH